MHRIEAVIATYGPGLARVAASYEADRALREDLLQEMLLAIHRALPGLREQASLGAFVFRIAHNRGVTHVIRQSALRRAHTEAPDDVHDPEAGLIADERGRRLHAAVRRLPLHYRQVITLVLEELSHVEIGEALGISVANVAVRVNRAKARLKELLDDR
ncbi:MAG: sigma-70 family RNA polymerase sigma factor [Sphingomonas sp.]